MSLQPRTAFQIPEETQRVARAAFPQGTLMSAARTLTGLRKFQFKFNMLLN